MQGLAAADAGLAHAPGDDRRMAGHPATAGEDALSLHDAVDVVRGGFHTHEDNLGTDPAQMLGLIRIEHH